MEPWEPRILKYIPDVGTLGTLDPEMYTGRGTVETQDPEMYT